MPRERNEDDNSYGDRDRASNVIAMNFLTLKLMTPQRTIIPVATMTTTMGPPTMIPTAPRTMIPMVLPTVTMTTLLVVAIRVILTGLKERMKALSALPTTTRMGVVETRTMIAMALPTMIPMVRAVVTTTRTTIRTVPPTRIHMVLPTRIRTIPPTRIHMDLPIMILMGALTAMTPMDPPTKTTTIVTAPPTKTTTITMAPPIKTTTIATALPTPLPATTTTTDPLPPTTIPITPPTTIPLTMKTNPSHRDLPLNKLKALQAKLVTTW
jgi:hypothetical protein